MEQLVEIIQNYVEVEEIPSSASFKTDLGLGSFDTVCMIDEIKEIVGVSLNAEDFVKYKTVGEMADYIETLK